MGTSSGTRAFFKQKCSQHYSPLLFLGDIVRFSPTQLLKITKFFEKVGLSPSLFSYPRLLLNIFSLSLSRKQQQGTRYVRGQLLQECDSLSEQHRPLECPPNQYVLTATIVERQTDSVEMICLAPNQVHSRTWSNETWEEVVGKAFCCVRLSLC